MRRLMLSLICLCLCKFSISQWTGGNDITISPLTIPASQANSTTSIAEYVKANFKTDREKASAIYSWVTTNIKYDTDSINPINLGVNSEAKITEAFRRRKGVCENYAAIFNDICIKSGLQCFVIDGYTKQSGFVDKIGHNWCALFIDRQWYLSEPTWGSTSGMKSKYFLVSPSEFIETHIPFDPLWQCLNYPITHQQFSSGYTYPAKGQSYFNYADSITAYFKLDSLQKLKSSTARIQQNGIYNKLVKDRVNFLKMHIEMINQDKDVDMYNASVVLLNEATAVYNNFVQYRNNRFTPLKTDSQLEVMLAGIDMKLITALKNTDEIDKSPAVFTFSTEALRIKLNALLGRINEQKEFLKRYLSTIVTDRNLLFYK